MLHILRLVGAMVVDEDASQNTVTLAFANGRGVMEIGREFFAKTGYEPQPEDVIDIAFDIDTARWRRDGLLGRESEIVRVNDLWLRRRMERA